MSADEKNTVDPATDELRKIRHQLKELTEAVYAMAGVMLMSGMPQSGPENAVSQLRTVRTAMSTEFRKQEDAE
ncbi:hypothetical protein [Oceanidesulfovibrio marinus]|uniref:Uncharacterized protein n=1 Tax=Oceanidesulfovibrio marinus TaxID=370038 RepID=A0A6P1ZL32_9BACT|nr:hypothetical protein [Oceanidesulfovibrio marinus]QJT09863.1 hypothetical protein E8L03_13365 [Oceanidesulfovibrio marinus]TVM36020.1 hypothetical protein DQK91_05070 [Oceanidesulfovibrio marinus]